MSLYLFGGGLRARSSRLPAAAPSPRNVSAVSRAAGPGGSSGGGAVGLGARAAGGRVRGAAAGGAAAGGAGPGVQDLRACASAWCECVGGVAWGVGGWVGEFSGVKLCTPMGVRLHLSCLCMTLCLFACQPAVTRFSASLALGTNRTRPTMLLMPYKCAPHPQLTEEETEYKVVCVRHVLDSHLVLQYHCTNTVQEQVRGGRSGARGAGTCTLGRGGRDWPERRRSMSTLTAPPLPTHTHAHTHTRTHTSRVRCWRMCRCW